MPYELQPFEPPESGLFYRMDGETAERHGQIGHLRVDFGKSGREFWTTWFDNQKHLKSYAFKEDFNGLMGSLRSEIFKDRASMRLFCGRTEGVSLGERGAGFKLRSGGYTCYLRCKPGEHDYDAYLFAYDDRYLLPELAGRHELPNDCEAVLPSTGEIIMIVMGENEYYPLAKSTPDRDMNRQIVSADNALMRVTRAQEEAMLCGSLFGWDTPAAKPWNYDTDGKPRIPPQRKRDEPER
jgi:hypothetical protein